MSRNSKSAFTLIELLVVIAIIAILAAILFPVFAQARAQARKASCLSNVKQVSLSVLMYVQDYDENLPELFTPNPTDTSGWGYSIGQRTYTWHNLVQPYTKNWQVFICPDSGRSKSDPKVSGDPFSNYGMLGKAAVAGFANWIDKAHYTSSNVAFDGIGGYHLDSKYIYPPKSDQDSSPLAAIAAPASMMMVVEGYEASLWASAAAATSNQYLTETHSSFNNGSYYTGGDFQGGPIGYHQITGSGSNSPYSFQWQPTFQSGQLVTSFVDGHVKAFQVKQFYSTKTTSSGQLVFQYMWPKE